MRLPRTLRSTANRQRPALAGVRLAGTLGFVILTLAGLTLLSGCTRRFFRQDADIEVAGVIQEKDAPEWELFDFNVYPHPLARFADPSDPDYPPAPPHDPRARLHSPHPQFPDKVAYLEANGYLGLLEEWDAANRARLAQKKKAEAQEQNQAAGAAGDKLGSFAAIEGGGAKAEDKKPAEKEPSSGEFAATVCPDGDELPPSLRARLANLPCRKEPFMIDVEQAVELAVLNSRDFQNRRENLYGAALPVTLERFNFLPQLTATLDVTREWAGPQSSVGRRNRLTYSPTLSLRQLFTTGGSLLVQLANTTVLDFTGTRRQTLSQSTLLLQAAQPFLRGGGRAVTLEPLTQAERNLVYNVRGFARFHREFYVAVAGGVAASAADALAGTVAGVGVGNSDTTVGYYPTLLNLTTLEDQRQNLEALEQLLKFYRAFVQGGGVSQLQVDQVEQQYLQARSRVLTLQRTYQDNLDQFKNQLGLPTELPVVLDPTPLEPLRAQMRRLEQLEADYRAAIDAVEKLGEREAAPEEMRPALRRALSQSPLTRGTRFSEVVAQKWQRWQLLAARPDQLGRALLAAGGLAAAAPFLAPALPTLLFDGDPTDLALRQLTEYRQQRERLLERRDQLEQNSQPVPADLAAQIRELTLEYDLGTLELALHVFEDRPWERDPSPARQKTIRQELFRRVAFQLALLAEEARLERAEGLAKRWPELAPVRLCGQDLLGMDEDAALALVVRTALTNRLDVMNERGRTMDAWRQIAVNANALLGTFNVQYTLDVLTPPPTVAQPLNFGANAAHHQLAFNFELPLVRQRERNAYRAGLISYQRQRRNQMLFEDQVAFQVRLAVRRLRELAESYKIQQRALQLAYSQADNALETFRAPPAPNEQRDAATAAAALTQQLLQAQAQIPQAQDNLFTAWVNYVIFRMRLYRDLELMRIDPRGVWIDECASPDPDLSGRPAPTPAGGETPGP